MYIWYIIFQSSMSIWINNGLNFEYFMSSDDTWGYLYYVTMI